MKLFSCVLSLVLICSSHVFAADLYKVSNPEFVVLYGVESIDMTVDLNKNEIKFSHSPFHENSAIFYKIIFINYSTIYGISESGKDIVELVTRPRFSGEEPFLNAADNQNAPNIFNPGVEKPPKMGKNLKSKLQRVTAR